MGRIGVCKLGLIDIATAQSILGKSRRTVFNLVKRGKLTPVQVPGSKKTWFKAGDVLKLTQDPLRSPKISTRLEKHLRRFHPYLFTPAGVGPAGRGGPATA